MDYRLTKLQRNQIFDLIQRQMPPGDFKWEEKTVREDSSKERHTIHVLWHLPTNFFYEFAIDCETYSPGEFARVQTIHLSSDKRIPWVMTWISRLKKEIEAPDL